MTATVIDLSPAQRPLPKPRLDWPAAFRAVRKLLKNKEDTLQVFEIMKALNGKSVADGYARMLTTLQGGRIAYERQELAKRLMDDAWLDSFAPGTVGAAYRDFIRAENLSADGLVQVSRDGGEAIDVAHPHAWFGRRIRDTHDIWHILSGYHRDALGEACLVAFSYAQTGGLGWAFIAVVAALRSKTKRAPKQPYVRAIWQGYQRGRAAAWLPAEDYDVILNEPLDAARRRLKITPATHYNAIPQDLRDLVHPSMRKAA
ncbi:MAG TPA: Coq4 family protein [Phenylobacterium sp.]|jgi:ubiquinone biosynthesis protein COQ4|uniref:Coq4 family protein n=1 Tax=Phenylobacterium conjunctum TaxID=1298959 RepID=A0ABW3T705_9CAUL|nr:Coq4 family protein [Phenylobacterium sp.]